MNYFVFHDEWVDIADEEVIPNICSFCRIRATFTWPLSCSDMLFGIRCTKHKIKGMINTASPEFMEIKFKKEVFNQGGDVRGKYVNARIPVECICKNGHTCFPRPCSVIGGRGMCRNCAGQCPIKACREFTEEVSNQGGEVRGKYVNAHIPVECICKNGHVCFPTPTYVMSGKGGICGVCAGQCPVQAYMKFEEKVLNLGGEVIGKYVNARTPVECKCKNGHICLPIPDNVTRGKGICRICAESIGERICGTTLEGFSNIVFKEREFKIKPYQYRYDWVLQLNTGSKILIEFHGLQHDKYNDHFHRNIMAFIDQRRRDLEKIKIALENGYKLIVLDYRWSKKTISEWTSYLIECFNRTSENLIADAKFHDWVFQYKNIEDSINKLVMSLNTQSNNSLPDQK